MTPPVLSFYSIHRTLEWIRIVTASWIGVVRIGSEFEKDYFFIDIAQWVDYFLNRGKLENQTNQLELENKMENEIINFLLYSKIPPLIGLFIGVRVLVKRIDRVIENIDRVKDELSEKIDLFKIELTEKIQPNETKNQEEHASLRLLVEKLIWYVEGNRRIEHPAGETDTEK